jgi:hypothetical protein
VYVALTVSLADQPGFQPLIISVADLETVTVAPEATTALVSVGSTPFRVYRSTAPAVADVTVTACAEEYWPAPGLTTGVATFIV